MFYISSITGSLTPVDPFVIPVSTTDQSVSAVAEVPAVTDITSTISSDPVAALVDSSTSQTLETQTAAPQTDDAAVFEGEVVPTTQDLIGVPEAITIGRAGAAMAYRIQEPDFIEEAIPLETIANIGSIDHTKSVNDDAGKSFQRVNPIKTPTYRYRPATKARKRAVVAADIMSSPVFSLQSEMAVDEAQKVFSEHKFRHIPILSSTGKLVGILSDRDFIANGNVTSTLNSILIKNRMTVNVLTARPQTEISAIAEVMIAHHIGCLPILDENTSLIGILTRSDILRAIVNHAPIELWT
jgi:acetoin utilization protein AcuB